MPTMKQAVIFDLDGTITRPVLDFDAMRAEIGIESGYILEAIAEMSAHEQARAESILHAHEEQAARDSILQDGAADTIDAIRRRGIPVGIVTRNARPWTALTLQLHNIKVDAIRSREDGEIKPSPWAILDICAQLQADPTKSWMIGDYRLDMEAGKNAGCKTVLMLGDRDIPEWSHLADEIIRRLPELLPLLEK